MSEGINTNAGEAFRANASREGAILSTLTATKGSKKIEHITSTGSVRKYVMEQRSQAPILVSE